MARPLSKRQKAYRVYLQSEHWKKLSAKAIERDVCKCVDCGSTEIIQVHHKVEIKEDDIKEVCALFRMVEELKIMLQGQDKWASYLKNKDQQIKLWAAREKYNRIEKELGYEWVKEAA